MNTNIYSYWSSFDGLLSAVAKALAGEELRDVFVDRPNADAACRWRVRSLRFEDTAGIEQQCTLGEPNPLSTVGGPTSNRSEDSTAHCVREVALWSAFEPVDGSSGSAPSRRAGVVGEPRVNRQRRRGDRGGAASGRSTARGPTGTARPTRPTPGANRRSARCGRAR